MSSSPPDSTETTMFSNEMPRTALSASFFSGFHRNGFTERHTTPLCAFCHHAGHKAPNVRHERHTTAPPTATKASKCAPLLCVRSMEGLGVTLLVRNLGFDERGKLCKRRLPTEIAHLEGNDFRQPFLHDVDLGATGHL